jgi:septation ring formation regulator EzrA
MIIVLVIGLVVIVTLAVTIGLIDRVGSPERTIAARERRADFYRN